MLCWSGFFFCFFVFLFFCSFFNFFNFFLIVNASMLIQKAYVVIAS